MYEFVDPQGERVTVRSVRTLGALLASGQINAQTRFRRADGSEFGAAADHAELRTIAAGLGVDWAAERVQPAPEAAPAAPEPDPAPAPIAAPPKRRVEGSVPATPITPPSQPAILAPLPWATVEPARRRALPAVLDGARRTGLVLACYGGTVLGGVAVSLLVEGLLNNRAMGTVSMVGGAGGWAWCVAHTRPFRRQLFTRWELTAGSLLFLLASWGLAGTAGLVVAVPSCAVLLTHQDAAAAV